MPENCERNLTIAVNPGSTTTKIAVYRGPQCLTCETLDHPKNYWRHSAAWPANLIFVVTRFWNFSRKAVSRSAVGRWSSAAAD